MNENAKEQIMTAARLTAQAHGYSGLNFRIIGALAGLKHASIYHHFPSKADLGAAIAKRYWQDTAQQLEELASLKTGPKEAIRAYSALFRQSLEYDNRMCLCNFMATEYDDLPGIVRIEVQTFSDINVAWLSRILIEAGTPQPEADARARAIFAAVSGAQLMARSRADVSLFDELVETFFKANLFPA